MSDDYVREGVDTELLSDFMSRFLGYGNSDASFWFVGMEEGGGSGLAELNRRLNAWDNGRRQSFEDLGEFHRRIELTKHFTHPVKLQRTWSPLIRCMLAARGKDDATNDEIKLIQANELGSVSGNTVLAELLPLPAPRRNEWPYASLGTLLPALIDRGTYANVLRSGRIEVLRNAIQSSRPEVVLFYGVSEIGAWRAISGASLVQRELLGWRVWLGSDTHSLYCVAPHPNTPGLTNDFWRSLGRRLSAAR